VSFLLTLKQIYSTKTRQKHSYVERCEPAQEDSWRWT